MGGEKDQECPNFKNVLIIKGEGDLLETLFQNLLLFFSDTSSKIKYYISLSFSLILSSSNLNRIS